VTGRGDAIEIAAATSGRAVLVSGLTVMAAMSGIIMVDLEDKQLAEISATLIQQVDFGCGAVGRLNRGGTVTITRIRVSPGIWKTSSSKIDINSRIGFLKTINKQQDESHIDFKSLASDTSIAQALQQLTYPH
jgi:hypothetical protein